MMPDFKTHTRFTGTLLSFFLIWLILLEVVFGISIEINVRVASLSILWVLIHIYYITPDFNWNSTPNRNLGPLGWIAKKLIHSHREGFTHSYIFWACYFIAAFYVLGYWTLPGIIPIFNHLIMDSLGD